MTGVPDTISVGALVAYNLMRIRKTLGLSQEQAAEQLEPFLGVRWSKAVYSAAERSRSGKRVRQFSAAEVAAFSLAFGVPVFYFYLPLKPGDRDADGVLIGDLMVTWPSLFELGMGGQHRNAVQLRVDELPIPEQPGNVHDLARRGGATWDRVSPAGKASRYDPETQQFYPLPDEIAKASYDHLRDVYIAADGGVLKLVRDEQSGEYAAIQVSPAPEGGEDES
jgi:hypothetical protein